jgi:hypothetical protein
MSQMRMSEENRVSGWVGWVWFAGVMMLVLGVFNALDGLVALFNDEYYTVTSSGLLVWDFTAWGWIHLGIGILMAGAGIAVLNGSTWGRVFGVLFAGLNMIAQLAFLSAYPVWAAVIIALDVFVIYALIVHGTEAKGTV